MKESSLIALIVALIGVVGALLSPIVGAAYVERRADRKAQRRGPETATAPPITAPMPGPVAPRQVSETAIPAAPVAGAGLQTPLPTAWVANREPPQHPAAPPAWTAAAPRAMPATGPERPQPVTGAPDASGFRVWSAKTVDTTGPEWQAWSHRGPSARRYRAAGAAVLFVALVVYLIAILPSGPLGPLEMVVAAGAVLGAGVIAGLRYRGLAKGPVRLILVLIILDMGLRLMGTSVPGVLGGIVSAVADGIAQMRGALAPGSR